jgi:hypothetical protein
MPASRCTDAAAMLDFEISVQRNVRIDNHESRQHVADACEVQKTRL